MKVEVDAFSGRPNPVFELAAGAADELLRRIASLPEASGAARVREGLGYRGLRVLRRAADATFDEIVVSGGVVVVRERGGTSRALGDPQRDLERWLVDAGSSHLDADLVAAIRQDIGT